MLRFEEIYETWLALKM